MESSGQKERNTTLKGIDLELNQNLVKTYIIRNVSFMSTETAIDREGKELTLEELFAQASSNEQMIIKDLPWSSDEGEAYNLLQARIKKLESIQLEVKTRLAEGYKAKRTHENKKGINRWDKESRGQIEGNSSDPRTNRFMSDANAKHKKALTKVESAVKGFLALGESPEDIIETLTANGKFKGIEIREAIEKFKASSED